MKRLSFRCAPRALSLAHHIYSIAVALTILLPTSLYAQWSTDPLINNPVCIKTNTQTPVGIMSDQAGGAYIIWQEEGGRSGSDIYAQHLNADGYPLWTKDGLLICGGKDDQLNPQTIEDGSGGIIVVWLDSQGSTRADLFAQKINGKGKPVWTHNGIKVAKHVNSQIIPRIISDGEGGALIGWFEDRDDGSMDFFIQHINSSGKSIGPFKSIKKYHPPTIPSGPDYAPPLMIRNGADGVLIAWTQIIDKDNYDIYAQSVTIAGNIQWASSGVPICRAESWQMLSFMISDGSGGAIIAWEDLREYHSSKIYAQHITNKGETTWSDDGLPIVGFGNEQHIPQMIIDGNGGAILTWINIAPPTGITVLTQHVDKDGNRMWGDQGLRVCSGVPASQIYPSLVSDASGGAIVTWVDSRNNIGTSDIYAQRVNASGNVQWKAEGVVISMAPGNQESPGIISDGYGGAIIMWLDNRNSNPDIFAQMIGASGTLGSRQMTANSEKRNIAGGNQLQLARESFPASFVLEQNYPNPFNPSTTIKFGLPEASNVMLKVYDIVGREVATLVNENLAAGYHQYSLNAGHLASGMYIYRIVAISTNNDKKFSFNDVKMLMLMK